MSYDLSKEELLNALKGFEENKTPGEDGFTEEYYEAFFDLIDRFHWLSVLKKQVFTWAIFLML